MCSYHFALYNCYYRTSNQMARKTYVILEDKFFERARISLPWKCYKPRQNCTQRFDYVIRLIEQSNINVTLWFDSFSLHCSFLSDETPAEIMDGYRNGTVLWVRHKDGKGQRHGSAVKREGSRDWVEKRAWFRGDGDGHDVGHGGDGGPRVRPWRRGKGRRVLVVVPGRHGLLRQSRVPAGGGGGGRQPGPEAHQQPDQQATAEGQASIQGDTQAAVAGCRGVGQIHHRQADADSARERLQRAREEAEDRGHQEEHSRCYKCMFFTSSLQVHFPSQLKPCKITNNSKNN